MLELILIMVVAIAIIVVAIHNIKSLAKGDKLTPTEEESLEDLEALVSTNEAQRLMGWTTEEFYQQRKEMYLRELDAKEKRQR